MRFSAYLEQTTTRHKTLIQAVTWTVIAAVILALASFLVATAGSAGKRNLAEAGIVILLPILLYIGIRRPFIFPFGLFVVLVPFDDLLRIDPRFGTLTKAVALAAGAAFAFWIVRKSRWAKPPSAAIPWIALLFWMALTLAWAIDAQQATGRLGTYALLICLYLIISLMPISAADYRWVLFTIVLGGVGAAAYIVYLYHTGAFVQYAQYQGVLTSRVLVRFGDEKLAPDELSATLLLPTAIVMTWALARSWSLAKLGLIGLFILLVGGMYVNGSRGGLVALAALIGYLILRSRFKLQLIMLSVLALGASFLLPTSPFLRFASAASTGGAGRVSIWLVGFAAFKQHWLNGAGVGNFPFAYDQSFITVFQQYYSNWHRAPHNVVLEFSVELGVIGLGLFLWGWYAQFRSLRTIPRNSALHDMRIALEGSVVALFVAGLFVGTMQGKFTWLLFETMALTSSFAASAIPAAIAYRDQHLPKTGYVTRPLPREAINA